MSGRGRSSGSTSGRSRGGGGRGGRGRNGGGGGGGGGRGSGGGGKQSWMLFSAKKNQLPTQTYIFTTHSNPFMFEQQNKGVVVEEVVEEVVDSNNNKIIHEVQVHQPNIITTLQTSTMAMATITTMHTIDLKAPYHHPVEEGITPLFEIRNKLIIVRRMVKRVPRHTPYQRNIAYN